MATTTSVRHEISLILNSAAASDWLKVNIQRALRHDILEAAYDAALLAKVLGEYSREIEERRVDAG